MQSTVRNGIFDSGKSHSKDWRSTFSRDAFVVVINRYRKKIVPKVSNEVLQGGLR